MQLSEEGKAPLSRPTIQMGPTAAAVPAKLIDFYLSL